MLLYQKPQDKFRFRWEAEDIWFARYPVQVEDGKVVWREYVERIEGKTPERNQTWRVYYKSLHLPKGTNSPSP